MDRQEVIEGLRKHVRACELTGNENVSTAIIGKAAATLLEKDAARIEQLEAVEKAAYRIELWFGEAFDKINLGHYKADVHSMFSDLTAARKALKGGE